MKKKLLIINQEQFGYHTDYFEYCKYLRLDFEITYLCWDYNNRNKITEYGVNTKYISRSGNKILRNFRFLKAVFKLINHKSFEFIMIHYFIGCSVIPLFCNRKNLIHLDIRSGSISLSSFKRFTFNRIIGFESLFFKSISVISDGLKKILRLSSNSFILPLGANPVFVERQLDSILSLIYIGTLTGRYIEDTVIGLGQFLEKHPYADIRYIIIGNGWGNEMELIFNKITEYKLGKYVELKGYIPYNELGLFLEKANIGVSYIPITPGYQFQPATKTYEYLLAGMPVIATGTYENKKIIDEHNGLIIDDSATSFADGIELLYHRINEYDTNLIRASVKEYAWKAIVEKFKENIFESMAIHQKR